MGRVSGDVARCTALAPMVHQATGGNTEILAQGWVVAQAQLLAKEGRLQLIVELAVQLLAGREELLTAQMTMRCELALMKVFDIAQRVLDLLQAVPEHVSAEPKRPACAADHQSDFGLMVSHEIGFALAQRL